MQIYFLMLYLLIHFVLLVFVWTFAVIQYINKLLRETNIKKSTGYDNLPPKIVKISADILTAPTTNLVNLMIKTSIFPDLKKNTGTAKIGLVQS